MSELGKCLIAAWFLGMAIAGGILVGRNIEKQSAVRAKAAEWYIDDNGEKAFRYKAPSP